MPADAASAATHSRAPWPPPADAPLIDSVVAAWRDSVLAPRRFYGALAHDTTLWPSILYYLVLGILVAGITLFWRMVLPTGPDLGGVLGEVMAMGTATTPLRDFLLSPLTLLISLFLSAGAVHVLLLILGGADGGFATTLRVFCFAYGAQVFAIVPVVGAFAGSIWMIVLAIIGLRVAHDTVAWKTATAVLVPLSVIMVLGILVAMLLAVGQVV